MPAIKRRLMKRGDSTGGGERIPIAASRPKTQNQGVIRNERKLIKSKGLLGGAIHSVLWFVTRY